MGLNVNGVRALCFAKRSGVDFSRSAMMGRQGLYLTPRSLSRVLREADIDLGESDAQGLFQAEKGFSEPLLAFLGATETDSFDASDYEGASQIYDLNLALPSSFNEKYTMVLDSGTLEHVFNFPVALKNCMEMVAEGGHLLILTPVNNFMGHGFYQFSPETFSCVLNNKNGFEIVKMIVFEDRPRAPWYEVSSPAAVNGRVTLCNKNPTYLFVIAVRKELVGRIDMQPQQSDYVVTWNRQGAEGSQERGISRVRFLNALKRCVSPQIRTPLWKLFVKVFCGGYDIRFYKRMRPFLA